MKSNRVKTALILTFALICSGIVGRMDYEDQLALSEPCCEVIAETTAQDHPGGNTDGQAARP